MKFEPWEDCKDANPADPFKPVASPPCVNCHYWRPQAVFVSSIDGPKFDSVKLCWYEDTGMPICSDFSCYTEREEE